MWSIAGATMRMRMAVCRVRMRITMLRIRVRVSARVWPSEMCIRDSMAVERYCLPNVIDALNEILGGSETDKNE